jgi:hypothetical protein
MDVYRIESSKMDIFLRKKGNMHRTEAFNFVTRARVDRLFVFGAKCTWKATRKRGKFQEKGLHAYEEKLLAELIKNCAAGQVCTEEFFGVKV